MMQEMASDYRAFLRAYHIEAYEKANLPIPENFEETLVSTSCLQ